MAFGISGVDERVWSTIGIAGRCVEFSAVREEITTGAALDDPST